MSDREQIMRSEEAVLQVFHNQFPALTGQIIRNLYLLSGLRERWQPRLLVALGALLLLFTLLLRVGYFYRERPAPPTSESATGTTSATGTAPTTTPTTAPTTTPATGTTPTTTPTAAPTTPPTTTQTATTQTQTSATTLVETLRPQEFIALIVVGSGLMFSGALFGLYQSWSLRKIILAQQVLGVQILNKQIDTEREVIERQQRQQQNAQLVLLPRKIRKRLRRC